MPQVPGSPFCVMVDTVTEGQRLLQVLAEYDMFQHYHNIKPDYCNAGGLAIWNASDQEWEDFDPDDPGAFEQLVYAHLRT